MRQRGKKCRKISIKQEKKVSQNIDKQRGKLSPNIDKTGGNVSPNPGEMNEKESQNIDEVEDLRIRRTRKLLQQALIELTVEKGFKAITVQDVSERAMVNRSTFYRHYLDKFDLLDKCIDDMFAEANKETLEAEKQAQIAGNPLPGPVSLLKHVQKFGDFYRCMLGENGDPTVCKRFRQNTERVFRNLLAQQDDDPKLPPIELRLSYISYAGIGAILWWLESDQPCPPEQLAKWLSQLSHTAAGVEIYRLQFANS